MQSIAVHRIHYDVRYHHPHVCVVYSLARASLSSILTLSRMDTHATKHTEDPHMVYCTVGDVRTTTDRVM